MFENLDDIIDHNLNKIFESKKTKGWTGEFTDLNNKSLSDSKEFARILNSKGLIDINVESWSLNERGFNIASNGGWIKYLKDIEEKENEESLKKQELEGLELDLAKSNLEANKLNKKIAKQNEKHEKFNKKSTIINIIIGVLNAGLIVWQILKSQ